LYAATDVYVWKLLRRDLRTSLAETTRVMERLVLGALADPGAAPGPTTAPGGPPP
jgi:hypothetical protein